MSVTNNLRGTSEALVNKDQLRQTTRTLTGDLTLVEEHTPLQIMDPGGADRVITLPAEATSESLRYHIYNSGNAQEQLKINDDGGSLVGTVNPGELKTLFCDGTTWRMGDAVAYDNNKSGDPMVSMSALIPSGFLTVSLTATQNITVNDIIAQAISSMIASVVITVNVGGSEAAVIGALADAAVGEGGVKRMTTSTPANLAISAGDVVQAVITGTTTNKGIRVTLSGVRGALTSTSG